jgi:very-short-patch-repair endonuclease
MERKMFYGAAPDLFYKAKRLREKMTIAEKRLREYLKENKMNVRFKAQHPIDSMYNEALTTVN